MRPAATPAIGEEAIYCRLPGRPRRLCFFSPFNRKSATDINGCLPRMQLLLERSCCALKKRIRGAASFGHLIFFSVAPCCYAALPILLSSHLPSINLADSELAQSPWLAVASPSVDLSPTPARCSLLVVAVLLVVGLTRTWRTPTVSVHCSLRRHHASARSHNPTVRQPAARLRLKSLELQQLLSRCRFDSR
jgi:hypothetical protein